jgi:hypothetical protein
MHRIAFALFCRARLSKGRPNSCEILFDSSPPFPSPPPGCSSPPAVSTMTSTFPTPMRRAGSSPGPNMNRASGRAAAAWTQARATARSVRRMRPPVPAHPPARRPATWAAEAPARIKRSPRPRVHTQPRPQRQPPPQVHTRPHPQRQPPPQAHTRPAPQPRQQPRARPLRRERPPRRRAELTPCPPPARRVGTPAACAKAQPSAHRVIAPA